MWDGALTETGKQKYLIASLDQAALKEWGWNTLISSIIIAWIRRHRLEETMETLAQIVRSGKALYAGISNYDGSI